MSRKENLLIIKKKLKKNESVFVKYIKKRLFTDREDFILLVTGKRGKGKSYACLSLGEYLSKDLGIPFSVDSNVKFTVKSMLAAVNNDEYQEGSVIINEEAGVSVNTRNFMQDVNKALSFFAQTVRFRRYVLIFNLPLAKFADVSLRSMATARLEMVNKNIGTGYSFGKLYLLDTVISGSKHTEYRRFLRLRTPDRRKLSMMSGVRFGLPSKELCKEYETKKAKFSEQLYNDIHNSIKGEMGEIENESNPLNNDTVLSTRNVLYDRILEFRNDYGLNLSQISKVTGYKLGMIRGVMKYAEREGLKIRLGNAVKREEFEARGIEEYQKVWKMLIKKEGVVANNEKATG